MKQGDLDILHPQLKKDCVFIGRFSLSLLLLMNDKQYPWFILVPARQGITEIFQLSASDRTTLVEESSLLAGILAQFYTADKMNIAAIGNVVPQLHLHHVVRYKNDPTWPAPVWGKLAAIPYTREEIDEIRDNIGKLLEQATNFKTGST